MSSCKLTHSTFGRVEGLISSEFTLQLIRYSFAWNVNFMFFKSKNNNRATHQTKKIHLDIIDFGRMAPDRMLTRSLKYFPSRQKVKVMKGGC